MVDSCHKISLEINCPMIFPGVMSRKHLTVVCRWQLPFLVSGAIAVTKYDDKGYLGMKVFIWV